MIYIHINIYVKTIIMCNYILSVTDAYSTFNCIDNFAIFHICELHSSTEQNRTECDDENYYISIMYIIYSKVR